tara:strand:+ start:389 stop:589 length:201 start_codon:yes stop_codon:yes gene_type:complete
MFVQSKATTNIRHKDGLAIKQRRGGKQTLIQWSNGDQQWCETNDLDYTGTELTLVQQDESEFYSYE